MTREVEMPLSTNHVNGLGGVQSKSLRGKSEVGVLFSPDGRVSEISNSMKERDQAKNELEAKRMDVELCRNNGMQNYPLAADDTPE